jgi:hypothetical protein
MKYRLSFYFIIAHVMAVMISAFRCMEMERVMNGSFSAQQHFTSDIGPSKVNTFILTCLFTELFEGGVSKLLLFQQ